MSADNQVTPGQDKSVGDGPPETQVADPAADPAADIAEDAAADAAQVDDSAGAASGQGEPDAGQESAAATASAGDAVNGSDGYAELMAEGLAESEVAALREQLREQQLRAEAELQNVRRRSAREIESARKFALEPFVKALLPTVDSLEKAIEASGDAPLNESEAAVIEGVRNTLRLFLDALGKEGVTTLDPHGEPFDPRFHEAVSMVENAEVEPNSVVAVLQKGYLLNDRLVRPAMVMVSREKPAADS